MNILVVGSGGREHTFCWKLAQSPLCDALYIAPGNAGTESIATNVAIGVNDFEKLGAYCLEKNIGLVVVGPEEPLVRGIVDYFKADSQLVNIRIFGPDKFGAQLEGSKDFSKEFMFRHNIPTAGYKTFTKDQLAQGLEYLGSVPGPYVLKADGLAAGKGVIITESTDEAKVTLKEMLADAKFGEASSKVVIEQFLDGIELSVFVITDGKNYVTLPNAKDYKRIGEGDTGLNTGGMGALSPVPFADEVFMQKVDERIIKPTVDGLKKENISYTGFIFFGLININNEPFVIEYNARMGDPETEVVIPRLENDLAELLIAACDGKLAGHTPKFKKEAASTVMLVSGGYPGDYEKGHTITGFENVKDVLTFHAGTAKKDGNVVSNGGRVIALTAYGDTILSALEKSYKAAQEIKWDGVYYRKDLGLDLKKYL